MFGTLHQMITIGRALLLGITPLALAVAILWMSSYEARLIRQSKPIQVSLEAYKKQHGQYPTSFKDIGIVERDDGPIYYERKSGDSYILWFGMELGESVVFESTNQTWVSTSTGKTWR
jgi:hypothetical protein